LNEPWAAPEGGSDLGVDGSVAPPAQHPALERPEDVFPERQGLGLRHAGHARHAENPIGAAAEAVGDLGLVEAFLEQAHDPSLEWTECLPLAHAPHPLFADGYQATSASASAA